MRVPSREHRDRQSTHIIQYQILTANSKDIAKHVLGELDTIMKDSRIIEVSIEAEIVASIFEIL